MPKKTTTFAITFIILLGAISIATLIWLNTTNKPEMPYIKWELVDESTSTTLDSGYLKISPEKINVERRLRYSGIPFFSEKEVWYSKNVRLNDSFIMGISIFPERDKSDLTGFGMWLRRTNTTPTFSWDWFVIEGDVSNKLQGPGILGHEINLIDSKWEITGTRFLTDVVLRSYRIELFRFINIKKPDWTVKIYKNSYINWHSDNNNPTS